MRQPFRFGAWLVRFEHHVLDSEHSSICESGGRTIRKFRPVAIRESNSIYQEGGQPSVFFCAERVLGCVGQNWPSKRACLSDRGDFGRLSSLPSQQDSWSSDRRFATTGKKLSPRGKGVEMAADPRGSSLHRERSQGGLAGFLACFPNPSLNGFLFIYRERDRLLSVVGVRFVSQMAGVVRFFLSLRILLIHIRILSPKFV